MMLPPGDMRAFAKNETPEQFWRLRAIVLFLSSAPLGLYLFYTLPVESDDAMILCFAVWWVFWAICGMDMTLHWVSKKIEARRGDEEANHETV